MNYFIEKYINNLTINNINDFAKKNNIFLTEKELNLLYHITKNNYLDILNGHDEKIKIFLKANLSKKNYELIINLYNEYKKKYQNYL